MGGPLGNFVERGNLAFRMGFPREETRFSVILNDVMLESKLFPLQVIIGNESDDDLMMVNTLRSFACCSRCRISVRCPNASFVSLSR